MEALGSTALRCVRDGGSPPYYVTDVLGERVAHAVFTRHGGVSTGPYARLNVNSSIGDDPRHVEINRERVMAALGRPRAGLMMAGLVHGVEVASVDRDTAATPLYGGGGYVPGVDALITGDPAVTLMITAADCAQVFFVDPVHGGIGLAHAGWRGAVGGVLRNTVAALAHSYGSRPADIRVLIGPCIGPCCAEFTDPHRELPAWCAPYIAGRHVDFWAMQRDLLIDAGVRPDAIAVARVCTVCHRDIFFSHRGDKGATGRFAAVLGLRP